VPRTIEGPNLISATLLIFLRDPLGDSAQPIVSERAMLAAGHMVAAQAIISFVYATKAEAVADAPRPPATTRPFRPNLIASAVFPDYRSQLFHT